MSDVLDGERRRLRGHLQTRRRPASGSADPADHFVDGSAPAPGEPGSEIDTIPRPGHLFPTRFLFSILVGLIFFEGILSMWVGISDSKKSEGFSRIVEGLFWDALGLERTFEGSFGSPKILEGFFGCWLGFFGVVRDSRGFFFHFLEIF